MSLTAGKAPFASHPSGVFNFARQGPADVVYWAPFPKRLRIVHGGATVVDSVQVTMLHVTDTMMRLCVPAEDVRTDLLQQDGVDDRALGAVQRWNLRVRDAPVDGAAISFAGPPDEARWLTGYFTFDLAKVDAWFQEDERGYAHPRDPYHRVDVHLSSRHVIARIAETVIAETREPAMLFETSIPPRYYFPPHAVRRDLLEASDTVSQCPYKGDGQHWHATASGQRVDDVGWSLTTPMGDATKTPGCVSLYPNRATVEVDGVPLA